MDAEYDPETVVQAAGAAPVATQTDLVTASSPAEAYVTAFCAATEGVRFGLLAGSPEDLVRVAAAFRAAEAEVRRWGHDRAGWTDVRVREVAQAFALGTWTWMMAGADDFATLLRDLQMSGRDASARMMWTNLSGTTLVVTLPAVLVLANRLQLIDAVAAAFAPGVERLRLDGAAIRSIDTAGLGALARILRMSVDASCALPQLVNAGAVLRESMRSVLLLALFEECGPSHPAAIPSATAVPRSASRAPQPCRSLRGLRVDRAHRRPRHGL